MKISFSWPSFKIKQKCINTQHDDTFFEVDKMDQSIKIGILKDVTEFCVK